MVKKKVFVSLLFVMVYSCGIYSFTDASVPPEVKTIKVNTFRNTAMLVNPLISTIATNELISKIRSQTRLFIVNKGNADYEISATITNYDVSTTNISNNQVTKNQLTLSITYNFINHIIDVIPNIKNGNFPISVNEEFLATQNLTSVENGLLDNMIPQITNQAFNKIFSSW